MLREVIIGAACFSAGVATTIAVAYVWLVWQFNDIHHLGK